MRIISGKARGTNLITLNGDNTRPTSDRAKEALFSMLGYNIIDCLFLDLFSGSGAIGIEAASRGASKVIVNDISKEAVNVIKKNIEKTKTEDEIQCYCLDYREVLEQKIKERQDYIFLDPPYNTNFLYESIKIIIEKDLIKDDGIIIAETDEKKEENEIIKDLKIEIINIKKYGRNKFIFLKKLSN